MTTLTNHKKSVRALCMSRRLTTFASGGADNIKLWNSKVRAVCAVCVCL